MPAPEPVGHCPTGDGRPCGFARQTGAMRRGLMSMWLDEADVNTGRTAAAQEETATMLKGASESEGETARSQIPMCAAENDQRAPRMLVPVNTSEFGEPALLTAACTARLMGAEVRLVAVLPPEQGHGTKRPAPAWYPSNEVDAYVQASRFAAHAPGPEQEPIETRSQAIEAARQQAYERLQEAARRFAGLPVTLEVVEGGSVAETIVDYARQAGVDLIVMPTHGRRPFAQALLGSVAAEVLHSGVAPCLLVKPPTG